MFLYIHQLLLATLKGKQKYSRNIHEAKQNVKRKKRERRKKEKANEVKGKGGNLIYLLHDARRFSSCGSSRFFLFPSLFQMIHDVNANALLYRTLPIFPSATGTCLYYRSRDREFAGSAFLSSFYGQHPFLSRTPGMKIFFLLVSRPGNSVLTIIQPEN